ncbi:HNH endonuclease, partial [[Kitasatospora] papulosa]|uniref:HNH endonuclease n=1 Tax=[Kitasatospora] papulosa TaxID=1464011 RepID=UPI0036C009A8
FLGYEFKAKKKKNKNIVYSKVAKNRKKIIKNKIKALIKSIQKSPTSEKVNEYNSYILGIHNYNRGVTNVSVDFREIYFSCLPTLYNRLKPFGKYEVPRGPPELFKKLFRNKYRTFKVAGKYLYPVADIQWKLICCFTQSICNYTKEGRITNHKELNKQVVIEIERLQSNNRFKNSVEYMDNRISKYSMQKGRCFITGLFLSHREVACHHIIPVHLGGLDEFSNLVVLHVWVHQLIHLTNLETIEKYKQLLQLNDKQIETINHLRSKCNLTKIH